MTLDEMVAEWQIAKATVETAQERFDHLTNEITAYMITEGVKSDLVRVRDKEWKVTVVQTERVKVDDDHLIKMIGKRLYNKVSIRKVDKKLLDDAIKEGAIDPAMISNSVVISTSKPFMRVTEYTGEPE